jgi:hypothetical protein
LPLTDEVELGVAGRGRPIAPIRVGRVEEALFVVAVIDRIERLPEKLPMLYLSLTR